MVKEYSEHIEMLVSWKYFPIIIAVMVCIVGWCITSSYMQAQAHKKLLLIMGVGGVDGFGGVGVKQMMPDERVFHKMIELPDRDPRWMTSRMVAPQVNVPSDEKRKGSKMEVFNMFYNNGIDDEVTFNSRPRNLYVIP